MDPSPRKLTTHQKAVLIQVLRTFPEQEVGVCYHPAASDALSYAQDFASVFKAIGWTVNDVEAFKGSNAQPIGLAFLVNGQDSLPPAAEALRDSLRIYEIEVSMFFDRGCSVGAGGFILAVGPHA